MKGAKSAELRAELKRWFEIDAEPTMATGDSFGAWEEMAVKEPAVVSDVLEGSGGGVLSLCELEPGVLDWSLAEVDIVLEDGEIEMGGEVEMASVLDIEDGIIEAGGMGIGVGVDGSGRDRDETGGALFEGTGFGAGVLLETAVGLAIGAGLKADAGGVVEIEDSEVVISGVDGIMVGEGTL